MGLEGGGWGGMGGAGEGVMGGEETKKEDGGGVS